MSWRIKAELRELLAAERRAGPLGGGGEISFVLAFANTYRLGMSNLGYQSVFGLLSQRPEIAARRAFLPEPDLLAEHRRAAAPWLTLEDGRPAGEAEVIGFSLPFENDYLNVLTLLGLAGIPLRPSLRRERDPLILAGGLAPTLNPEPLAPYLDLILLGEAEELLPEFIEAYGRVRGRSRPEIVETLARQVPGLYAPGLYRPVYDENDRFLRNEPLLPGLPQKIPRRRLAELKEPVVSPLVSPNTEFPERPLIEVSRGCGRGCRFCAAGHIIRPPRRPPFEATLGAVKKAAAEFGSVGLISAAVSDLPGIEELCLAAVHEGAKISLSSLRADTLSPPLARLLAEAGAQTLTLAPEAGSQRLRDAVNKGLTEDDILEACLHTIEAGIRKLRLYFMIGLPTETDEDVRAIAALTKRIGHHIREVREGDSFNLITLSVSSFVPKPHTPFQWAAMNQVKELSRKARLLKTALKGEKRVKITFDSPKWAAIEALLSRGDRKVGEILERVHQLGGDWKEAFKETNLNPDFYTLRKRGKDEPFPWEIVDSGISREYLWREYQRAKAGKTSPECRDEGCSRCGVC